MYASNSRRISVMRTVAK